MKCEQCDKEAEIRISHLPGEDSEVVWNLCEKCAVDFLLKNYDFEEEDE